MISGKTIDLSVNAQNADLTYYRIQGVFFTFDTTTKRCDNYESCRELFGEEFKRGVKWIGYTAIHATIERISEFFDLISSRLSLPIEDRITFYRTSVDRVIILQVPYWWRCTQLRRELLTLFLRSAAEHFKTGTVEDAFSRYNLLKRKNVRFGVERFLNGYTVLHKNVRLVRTFDTWDTEDRLGFCDTMNGMTEAQIERNLLKVS